jgi:hypothetical protein
MIPITVFEKTKEQNIYCSGCENYMGRVQGIDSSPWSGHAVWVEVAFLCADCMEEDTPQTRRIRAMSQEQILNFWVGGAE